MKPKNPVKFLLVDDLEENLLALEGLLRQEGLELLKARSGQEALELLLVHEVSLAILDVQMPGMDGLELAELMRGTERTRRVPIIFVTAGAVDKGRRFRGYEAGAVDFIYKPIEPDILRGKAQVFYELARQRNELRERAEENARLLQERAEAEKRLQESEAQVRRVLDSLFAFVAELKLDGTLVGVNRAPLEVAGLTARDVIGKKFWECYWWNHSPEVQAELRAAIHRANQGETVRYDVLVQVAGGARMWVDFQLAPLRDSQGTITHLIPSGMDITSRREAEEKLRYQLHLTERIATGAAEALFLMDVEGHVTYMNPAAEQMFGWKREELEGKVLHDSIHYKHPDGSPFPMSECPLGLVMCAGKSVQAHEDVFFGRGDRPISVRCSNAPVFEGENMVGAVLVVSDITEQKQAEQALRHAQEELKRKNEDLEEKVQQRTAKLQEAVSELEAFSYSIAHDMRAPLRSMTGYSNLLLEDYSKSVDEVGSGYLKRIAAAAKRMDHLIQDVLNYSTVVRAQAEIKPVNLRTLLEEIVDSYPIFREQGADIDLKGPFPTVLGNEAMLTQCLSNLMGNAVKFVAAGVKPQVRVWTENINGQVRLLVRDNGIGISPDQHEKIFGMFQRVDKGYEGTGIGLAVVQKAVQRMGGNVGVESEPGVGSTFWIELPAAKNV